MRHFLTLLTGIVLAVGLVACDSNGDGEDDGPTAQVRVMHASPDIGAVNILVDGEEVATGVSFSRELTNPSVSEYYDVPVGSDADIEIQDSGGNTILTTNVDQADLDEDTRYTLVVAGAMSAPQAETPQEIILRDQYRDNLGDNDIGLRLVHGSGLAGAVDIYLNEPGTELTAQELIAENFQFTQDFPGGFAGQFASQPLSEDGSVLVVTPTGSTDRVLELPVGTSEGLQVQAGMHVTGVAIDDPESDPPVGALVHIDTP